MTAQLDVRAAVRGRIERGIRALNPDAPNPEQMAEVALSALADGAEWLMSLAEEYQRRAHTAEKALAELRAERSAR